jgi:hypothetical protein
MLRSMLASVLLVAAAAAPAAARCPADVAIVGASLKSIDAAGPIGKVNVAITVRNVGTARQPGNTLQSVQIFQGETKTGTKGIPPLRPGESYTFIYSFPRSVEAARHSTQLALRLVVASPPGIECVSSNDFFKLNV